MGRFAALVTSITVLLVAPGPVLARQDTAPVYTCTDSKPVTVAVVGVTICTASTRSPGAVAPTGVLVRAVTAGGLADAQGLRADDVIYRIADVDVDHAPAVATELEAVSSTSDLVVNFVRQGSIYLVRLRKKAP